jgi:hypothetical protein
MTYRQHRIIKRFSEMSNEVTTHNINDRVDARSEINQQITHNEEEVHFTERFHHLRQRYWQIACQER